MLACRKERRGAEEIFEGGHVFPLVLRLPVFVHERGRVGFPDVDRRIFRLDFFVKGKFFRDPSAAAEHERVERYTEFFGYSDQVFEVGERGAALPFLHRLPGNADQFGKFLLRKFGFVSDLTENFVHVLFPPACIISYTAENFNRPALTDLRNLRLQNGAPVWVPRLSFYFFNREVAPYRAKSVRNCCLRAR